MTRHALCSFFVVTMLAGCSLDNPVAPDTTPIARLSFFHACPDGPNLIVQVNDVNINGQVFSFGSYNDYIVLKAGTLPIKFKNASSLTLILDTLYTFSDKGTYSLYVINSLAQIKGLLIQDNGFLQSPTNTMVRFIHLSPDAPAVTAILTGSKGPFFSGGYKEISDFVEMTPQQYTLEVRAQSDNQLILSIPVPTVAGSYYTLALTGYQTPPPNNGNTLAVKVINN